jgi:hypothetical protein
MRISINVVPSSIYRLLAKRAYTIPLGIITEFSVVNRGGGQNIIILWWHALRF